MNETPAKIAADARGEILDAIGHCLQPATLAAVLNDLVGADGNESLNDEQAALAEGALQVLLTILTDRVGAAEAERLTFGHEADPATEAIEVAIEALEAAEAVAPGSSRLLG